MKFNPFRLWGSYLGLTVGLLLNYPLFGLWLYLAENGLFASWMIILPFIIPIAGFIIGGLLHMEIRKEKL